MRTVPWQHATVHSTYTFDRDCDRKIFQELLVVLRET